LGAKHEYLPAMTLKEKLKWDGAIANRLATVERTQCKIAAGKVSKAEHYWFVGEAHGYLKTWLITSFALNEH
jgi:hypothetical protein